MKLLFLSYGSSNPEDPSVHGASTITVINESTDKNKFTRSYNIRLSVFK